MLLNHVRISAMSDIPKDLGQKYIAAYREAARIMDALRAAELPSVSTTKTLISLLPAFEACVRERPVSNTSGLIEQQRIFARARTQ